MWKVSCKVPALLFGLKSPQHSPALQGDAPSPFSVLTQDQSRAILEPVAGFLGLVFCQLWIQLAPALLFFNEEFCLEAPREVEGKLD